MAPERSACRAGRMWLECQAAIRAERRRGRATNATLHPVIISRRVRRPQLPGPALGPCLAFIGFVVAVAAVLAACASAAPSFDPAAPCGGAEVQQRAGAYPDLEARIPKSLAGKAPERLDSGRYCSAASLGTLVAHGLHEVHFAGGIYPASDRQAGISIVVFAADGLTATWMADSYEAGARADKRTSGVQRSSLTIAGRPGFRIDALHSTDTASTSEAVLVWPSADGRVVQVVIGSGVTEEGLRAAVDAFAG